MISRLPQILFAVWGLKSFLVSPYHIESYLAFEVDDFHASVSCLNFGNFDLRLRTVLLSDRRVTVFPY